MENKSVSIAWGITILLLPLTSLPLLTALVQTNTVAAPSTVPIAWLVVTWMLPFLLRGGRIPRQTLPFLGLILIALIASARAFFIEIPSFKGKTILPEEVDAILTLGIGSAVYLVAATWPRNLKRLAWTMQLINLSGLILVAWSLWQGYYIFFNEGEFPAFMVELQSWFSIRRLFSGRATGFAFEPSWLAHQLNMVYLPYWLAASVRKYSAHRFRLWKFSLENLLLAGGVIVLALSFSRVGWLAFFLMIAYLLIKASIALARRLYSWTLASFPARPFWRDAVKFALSSGILLTFVGVYIGTVAGLVYLAGIFDPRLTDFFEHVENADGFYDLTSRLAFAERVVYWTTGWEVFNEHPFLGVGLGNTGFFFPEEMPAFGYNLPEIKDQLYRRDFIPNTKSLWARLLAETGIIGFSFFATWLYILWKSARHTQTSSDPLLKTLGEMGTLVLLAFLIEGFSIDSFALPYLWFSPGLLTAAASLFGKHAEIRVGAA